MCSLPVSFQLHLWKEILLFETISVPQAFFVFAGFESPPQTPPIKAVLQQMAGFVTYPENKGIVN